MTYIQTPGLMARPACAVAPMAMAAARMPDDDAQRLILSLPHIHCAACITAIESALMALPGVSAARVNLTRKRATIHAAPGIDADTLIAALARIGHEAHELDGDALSSGDNDAQGRDLLLRLGVSGFAMMNVMLLSVAVWSGAEDATRTLFHWISAMIALPTVAFAGQPFFRSAWASLWFGSTAR